jgi:hypothetical protein
LKNKTPIGYPYLHYDKNQTLSTQWERGWG